MNSPFNVPDWPRLFRARLEAGSGTKKRRAFHCASRYKTNRVAPLAGALRSGRVALLMSALLVGVASPTLASTTPRATPDPLFQASEIAEQLSENAATIDAATFKKAVANVTALDARLSTSLSADRKKALDTFETGIRNAWQTGNRSALAVQSIEAYRVLQESMPRGARSLPVQVAQLDYSGFKAKGLLLSPSVDWMRMTRVDLQASQWWSGIEPRVSDATLKEGMNRALLGMKQAVASKDARMLSFAADMELVLVDGLEASFATHVAAR